MEKEPKKEEESQMKAEDVAQPTAQTAELIKNEINDLTEAKDQKIEEECEKIETEPKVEQPEEKPQAQDSMVPEEKMDIEKIEEEAPVNNEIVEEKIENEPVQTIQQEQPEVLKPEPEKSKEKETAVIQPEEKPQESMLEEGEIEEGEIPPTENQKSVAVAEEKKAEEVSKVTSLFYAPIS